MKKMFFIVAAMVCCTVAKAQDMSKVKVLEDSVLTASKAYVDGNKYQKDAILFVGMLADTHPYYIKKERRDVLMAAQEKLLDDCSRCADDSTFVVLLQGALGELRDKHTDVISMAKYEAQMGEKKKKEEAAEKDDSEAMMAFRGDLFHYTLVPERKVCYLQFNKCQDARTARNEQLPRWDKMLDEMFLKMKEAGVNALVVDAQYNNGGSSMLCDELLVRLRPFADLRNYTTYLRFSSLMGAYNPRIAVAKKAWEEKGHADELYKMPQGKPGPSFVQPEVFGGKVVFVQGERTFSSAGILMTLVRDNKIGLIVGTKSSYGPSHYGEVLPYRLPNTGVLGSVSCKFFVRPDAEHVDDKVLCPDVELDLSDKEKAWEAVMRMLD